jgi:hypothetical protein
MAANHGGARLRHVRKHSAPEVPFPRWIALVALVLLTGAVLIVIYRPQARGKINLDPAPSALTAGNPVGAPSSVPGGPADSGVEPPPGADPSSAAGGGSVGPGDVSAPAAPAGSAASGGAGAPGGAPVRAPVGGSSGGSGGGPGVAPPQSGPPRPVPPQPAPPAPKSPAFAALSGENCPQKSNAGYYRKGWASDWYTRSRGGWTGDGCGGQIVAVPMSGDAKRDDNDNVIVWWFTVGSGASCAISVYVPGTGDVRDADGAPATYFVYGTTNASGSAIASFTVDQVHNQGRWVGVGTFAQRTGQLSVRMVTRGIDWGSGRTGAHLGVSALRVTC